jgi:hypothetical protein
MRPTGPVLRLARAALLVAAAALSSSASRAQVPPAAGVPAAAPADTSARGPWLELTSVPPGAGVYSGGVFLGVTPLGTVLPRSLAGGSGVVGLTIAGGDPGRWLAPVVVDSIRLPADSDTIARRYDLPRAVRISSGPPGAGVFLADSLLGTTPLFALLPRAVALLTLRMAGYAPQTLPVDSGMPGLHAELVPTGPGAAMPALSAEPAKYTAPLFIATGTAVIAGAAAAWLKSRADGAYAEYAGTGDRGALDRVRRYDRISGIALAAAEISLGYLVIQLLSR